MGKQYASLDEKMTAFIGQQKIFFVGTATDESRVNISPKGMDSLRVVNDNRVVWLNVTGSGNETAAHLQTHPRMTILFCAFDGNPYILRLYGQAKAIHKNDPEWESLYALFPPNIGARQIMDLRIELVQISCGMAVPNYVYEGDRTLLNDWAEKRGEDGLKEYWAEKNQVSLDAIPTLILEKNT